MDRIKAMLPNGGLLRTLALFALGGAALFALDQLAGRASPDRFVIRLTRADLQRVRADAAQQLGRAPTAAELERWIDAAVVDDVLYREARALGWDRTDPVVQRRLVRNMAFLGGDADADALLREARALGLDRSDVVVRRRLVQRMRLALAESAQRSLPPPSEGELERFRAAHAGRFSTPPAVAFSHILFAGDRTAENEAQAVALLAELRAADASPEAASGQGDSFVAGSELGPTSRDDVATLFGADFADAILAAPPGRWSGPVRSTHGVHVVFVRERSEAQPHALEAVRAQVRDALAAERAERAVQRAIQKLRAEYVVEVDGGARSASPRGSSPPSR